MADRPTQREYWGGKVGDEWAHHATQIDAMMRGMTEAALARGAFRSGERVLDIGCGAGATSLEIAQRVAPGGALIGVDLSPPLLRVARARAADAGLNATFLEADASTLRLDAPADAAFSRFGVMFFEDSVAAFANIRANLRAGGRLAFLCWRSFEENVWTTMPVSAVAPLFKAPLALPDPNVPGPYAFAAAAKIERILTEAGWREIEIARWDGDIQVGGGGDLEAAANFLLRIGPCARAIAEQGLDAAEAKARVMDKLAPHYKGGGVELAAACWMVTAVG